MGEKTNDAATAGTSMAAGGGATTPATDGGAGSSARPQGGGGAQADQEKDDRLFTNPDGTRMTPEQLREEADIYQTEADAQRNLLNEAEQGGTADDWDRSRGQDRITRDQSRADALRAEADRLDADANPPVSQPPGETQPRQQPSGSLMDEEGRKLADWERTEDGTTVTTEYDPQTGERVGSSHRFPEQQADYGAVQNPDGSTTHSRQYADGTLQQQTVDAEGHPISQETTPPDQR